MLSQIPSSVRTAFVMTLLVILYFGGSTLFRAETAVTTESIEDPLPRVVTRIIEPGIQNQIIEIRGRTKAKRIATLRAETAGQVEATPAEEGGFVIKGTTLCLITKGVRGAGLAEAEAAFQKARIDYQAALELSQKGFQSDAAVASAKAAYDLSEANLTRARTDFVKTRITAPFDGILQTRHVEVGDLLSLGSACATVSQLDPVIIEGSVSEKEIILLRNGVSAKVTVSTGDTLEANVTMVSAMASPTTRTFMVELEAPNPQMLPDGLTANARIELGGAEAHIVPRNALLRDDTGSLGVRVVENIAPDTGIGDVRFVPVSILRDEADGIWVAGMQDTVELIVRGQDYVKQGQRVETAQPGDTLSTG